MIDELTISDQPDFEDVINLTVKVNELIKVINDLEAALSKTSIKKPMSIQFNLMQAQDGEFETTFQHFVEMRKKIKKPLTEHAANLILKKLDNLSNDIKEQIKILNASIANDWSDVYQLRDERPRQKPKMGTNIWGTGY